jgi:hypothetical protein
MARDSFVATRLWNIRANPSADDGLYSLDEIAPGDFRRAMTENLEFTDQAAR